MTDTHPLPPEQQQLKPSAIDIYSLFWQHVKIVPIDTNPTVSKVYVSPGKYQILNFGVLEKTLEPMVVYKKVCPNPSDEVIFIRPVREFFDGRFRLYQSVAE